MILKVLLAMRLMQGHKCDFDLNYIRANYKCQFRNRCFEIILRKKLKIKTGILMLAQKYFLNLMDWNKNL